MKHLLLALASLGLLSACGSLFQTHEVMPTVYELRAPAPAPAASRRPGTLIVARARVRPGLESDRIAVTLADRRLDAYGGSRWSAPLPEMVGALLIAGLRESRGFEAVVPERSAFGGEFLLQPEIEAFEADYSQGGAPPTVHVRLGGEFGLKGERRMLATVTGSADVRAAADRQREVIAAFESAYAKAAAEMIAAINAAADAAPAAAR